MEGSNYGALRAARTIFVIGATVIALFSS